MVDLEVLTIPVISNSHALLYCPEALIRMEVIQKILASYFEIWTAVTLLNKTIVEDQNHRMMRLEETSEMICCKYLFSR